ncbi:uncharacterized protein FRV6_12904 [Fusarium oxysporum]|uniref:Uncharacterized protein n=1 Tax=Fusarium oxysporum TaxID=5507 RepID=A0A2H3TJL6_FUSOX|nr:uncharacterized protein FRV6_12904 [Fusarium oxysporum]
MDDVDDSSQSSDDSEVERLREQLGNVTNEMNEMRQIDPGEILKPSPPKYFDGTLSKLPTFLTQSRAFITYYPNQFRNNAAKVIYMAGRLIKTAA